MKSTIFRKIATALAGAWVLSGLSACQVGLVGDRALSARAGASTQKVSVADPRAALDLAWGEGTITRVDGFTATWTPSDIGVAARVAVQFYQGASCDTPVGAEVAVPSVNDTSLAWAAGQEGAYSFKVISYSTDNEAIESSCSSAIVLDQTPPDLAFETPDVTEKISEDGSVNVVVSGDCSENDKNIAVSATRGGNTVSASPVPQCHGNRFSATLDVSSLSDGAITFRLAQTDEAGNAASMSIAATKDTVKPLAATSVDWAEGSMSNSRTIHATWAVSLSGDLSKQKFQLFRNGTCTLASGSPIAIASASATSYPITVSADGHYSFQILSVDDAGNEIASACSGDLLVDTVAPSLASAAITNASPSSTRTYNLSFGAADSYADYCILANDTDRSHCSWTLGALPATYIVSAVNEAKILSVWIRDAAGNPSARVATNSVTLDTSNPTLTISSPATTSYVNYLGQITTPTVGTCSENGRTVTVRAVSGATYTNTATCSGGAFTVSMDYRTLTDGVVTLTASQTDAAGNTGSVSSTVTKDIVISSSASNLAWSAASPTTNRALTATWTKSNAADLDHQALNAYANGTCAIGSTPTTVTLTAAAQTTTWTAPADGTYSFMITSYDVAGNAVTSSCLENMVVDATAPVLASATASIGSRNGTNTTLTLSYGTVTGSYSAYCIGNNDDNVANCSWVAASLPASYTRTSANENFHLSVWLKDAAGNVSSRVATATIADSTTPTTISVLSFRTASDRPSSLPIRFDIEFSYPIDSASFTSADITEGLAEVSDLTYTITDSGDSKRFTLTVDSISGPGRFILKINGVGITSGGIAVANGESATIDYTGGAVPSRAAGVAGAGMDYDVLNGTLYVFGGYTSEANDSKEVTNKFLKYSFTDRTWTQIDVPDGPRAQYGAKVFVADAGGRNVRVYVFGGFDGSNAETTEAMYYNSSDNKWYPVVSAVDRHPTLGSSTAAKDDGRRTGTKGAFFFGGRAGNGAQNHTLTYFNFATNLWGKIVPLNDPADTAYANSQVVDGLFVVMGGQAGDDAPINQVISYDPTGNRWATGSIASSPLDSLSGYAMMVKEGTTAMVFGGKNDQTLQNKLYSYTSADGFREEATADAPSARQAMACASGNLNGHAKSFFLGGLTGASEYSADLYEYDYSDGKWSKLSTIDK